MKFLTSFLDLLESLLLVEAIRLKNWIQTSQGLKGEQQLEQAGGLQKHVTCYLPGDHVFSFETVTLEAVYIYI